MFYSQVIRWINRITKDEIAKLNEIKELQSAQQKLSMVDNFVEYSKIQRKINKISECLKESKSANTNEFVMKIGIPYGLRLLVVSILVILCLYYRSSSLFYLDGSLNLFPFGYLVSFPNGVNSVSIHFWVMCCTAASRLIKI